MEIKIDEVQFGGLMEESQDLQSDAMKVTHRDLGDYVEAAREARSESRHRPLPTRTLLTAGAVGVVGVSGLALANSAWAATASTDVQALQTAAGIENLAVATYKLALGLPFIGGSSANGVVKAFSMMTMSQHEQHAMAFNAAAAKLGGKLRRSRTRNTHRLSTRPCRRSRGLATSWRWRSPSRTSRRRPTSPT